MRISWILAPLLLLINLTSSAFAKANVDSIQTNDQQHAGLRLRQACKEVCKEARTSGEVARCVSTQEAVHGAKSFDQAHPLCALAKKNYLAAMNEQTPQNEPERYG